MSRQKFRYARTYTVIYDARKEDTIRAEKQWRLLKDSVVVLPRSIHNLTKLFHVFQAAPFSRALICDGDCFPYCNE